jgi:hypothetical protein
MDSAPESAFVEPKVPHRPPVPADQAQRLNADLDLPFGEFRVDDEVRYLRLHPVGDHGLIAHQEEGTGGDVVGEAGGEDGGGLHVDGHAAHGA